MNIKENREKCPMRHENGNCLPVGGFCLAVSDVCCNIAQNAYNSGNCDAHIGLMQKAFDSMPDVARVTARLISLASSDVCSEDPCPHKVEGKQTFQDCASCVRGVYREAARLLTVMAVRCEESKSKQEDTTR